jgi:transcriptional regulator with XRE-family HTH domain
MNKKAFGKRINTARKEKRVTSEKLSEIVGKNAVFIRQIEGANKLPSLPTFVDICNALNVSPNYLLFDSIKDNAQDNVEEIIIQKIRMLTPEQTKVVLSVFETLIDGLANS